MCRSVIILSFAILTVCFESGCVSKKSIEKNLNQTRKVGNNVSITNCHINLNANPHEIWCVIIVRSADTSVSRTDVASLIRNARLQFGQDKIALWDITGATFEGYRGQSDILPIMDGTVTYNFRSSLLVSHDAEKILASNTSSPFFLEGIIRTCDGHEWHNNNVTYVGNISSDISNDSK